MVLRIRYKDSIIIPYRRGMFLEVVRRNVPGFEDEMLLGGFEKSVLKRFKGRGEIKGYELFQEIESEIRSRSHDGLAERFRSQTQGLL